MSYRIYIIALVLCASLLAPSFVMAEKLTFPRLANPYYTDVISESEARELAKWDVLVLGFEIPVTSPSAFKLIKQLNPNIILLGYSNSILKNGMAPTTEPSITRYYGTKDEWLLRSPEGATMGYWPGTKVVNPTDYVPQVGGKRWNDFLPEFTISTIKKDPLWNGVFFDDAMHDIAWLNNSNIDINGDGAKDSWIYVDDVWRGSMTTMFGRARLLAGPATIFVTNSSNTYGVHTNGRLFESYFEDKSNWVNHTQAIQDAIRNGGYQPRYVMVNSNTANTGDWQNWQKFRYAYTSSLMTDAYFSYNFGDQWHQQLWWYDEYDADLGAALEVTHVLTGGQGSSLGVWRRDFENGIALVNTTGVTQTVSLHEEFWKIAGKQDKVHNDGSLITTVSLSPYDGIVLTRTVTKPVPAPAPQPKPQPKPQPSPAPAPLPLAAAIPHHAVLAGNAAEIRSAVDGNLVGNTVLQDPALSTGQYGLIDDLDGDGMNEKVVYDRGVLTAWHGQVQVWEMRPYDAVWSGRVNMASGDIDGDRKREIVLVAGKGGGPHVRIVGYDGILRGQGFFAGDPVRRGGASLALADVGSDGIAEIIIGSGGGITSRVTFYNSQGVLISEFVPYGPSYLGGVNVAAGDLNGDSVIEIIASPAGSGENAVKIYNAQGSLMRQFNIDIQKPEEGVRVLWWNVPPYTYIPEQFLIDRGQLSNIAPDRPILQYLGR